MTRKGEPADRAASAKDLKTFRVQSDGLDVQILKLINERAGLAGKIGQVKTENNDSVFSPAREEEVLSNVLPANRGPLPEVTIRASIARIISGSRRYSESTRSPSLGRSIRSVTLRRSSASVAGRSTWAWPTSRPCSRK